MPRHVEPFHAMRIGAVAHALQTQGSKVVHMEFGQPSSRAPVAALAAARNVLDVDPMGYWESPPLRERIAGRYEQLYGLDISPDRIVLTAGASPALVLALTSGFDPGARIVVARPGYVAYRNTIHALHLDAIEVECGEAVGYRLTAETISRIDPAPDAVIVASPANPTGTIIRGPELKAIADACRRRNILLISDEIYHGISYGEALHSMLEFSPHCIVINSFSKYFSMAGWRLGWLVAPVDRLPRIRACAGNLFLTPPSISQHAALAAMDAVQELEGHLVTYRRNRARLIEALPLMGLDSIAPPDGAFYIYVDIGHLTTDSLSFCERLLRETGVATAPGLDFDPVDGGRFMRFSFAVSSQEVEDAIARLIPWFAQQTAALRSRARSPA